MGKPANVVLQVVEPHLSLDDRDRTVQDFIYFVNSLDLAAPGNLMPLVDKPNGDYLYGLQILLHQPENVVLLVQDLSDRLEAAPVEIRLTITLDRVRLQVQTASTEDLLSILPALNTLMPAQRIFRARAELYARRGGEFSPVEEANLELLRYQLDLAPDAADALISRALGPYRYRQDKLEKYREVLNAELERQSPPLSESTWAELRRLYLSLGLTYDDVAPIDQEYIARLQAEVTLLQQKEEATRLQEETLLQIEANQQQLVEQQNLGEMYRQEFAEAIATTMFPSEFDRGRLEQARRTWELDAEQVRAIEREVTDERYGPIDSAAGVDYTRLRQLLWLNQWEAADQETERLILMALSRDMQPLEDNAILKLSCVDFQTIDLLWSRYSQGKFGFLAQHQVYVQQERQIDGFLRAIGWKSAIALANINLMDVTKPYRDLQFGLNAPAGHLPTWRWGAQSLEGDYAVNDEIIHHFFTDLVEKCLPGLRASVATVPVDTPAESP